LIENGIAIGERIAERDPFGSLWSAKAPILDRTWRDQVLARLWRSVKSEEVYLRVDPPIPRLRPPQKTTFAP
jgi:hypothetical protein